MLFDYDRTSAESILEYAKRLTGKTFGDVKRQYLSHMGNVERDDYPLPDGQRMTIQSFWINNRYILAQL